MEWNFYEEKISEVLQALGYVCDINTYELIYMTQTLMDAYGFKNMEEYYGQPCYKILQGFDEPCAFCTNDKIKNGQTIKWEHFNTMLNKWYSIEDNILYHDGRTLRIETGKEITAEKTRITDVTERLTEESAMVQCLQLLSGIKNVDEAVCEMLKILGTFYQADRTYIFQIDNMVINNTYEWCNKGITEEIDNLQNLPLEYIDSWIKKFEESGEFCISSLGKELEKDSEEYKILSAQGIQSLMAAPLIENDKIVGFIGADNPSDAKKNMTLLRRISRFVQNEIEKSELIKELERRSYTDLLTGIYNRNRYVYTLEKYKEKPLHSSGVIYVDVNGMKNLNDTYGHDYGDQMLMGLAKALNNDFPQQVYRIGGDEFVILCENIREDEFLEKADAIKRKLSNKFDISVGYNWSLGNLNIEKQIHNADERMYAEKQIYYQSILSNERVQRPGIATSVLREIKDGHYTVYYQPQFNLKTNEIIGTEALIRKIGPGGKMILPEKFVPYYEASGVIRHLDLYVFKSVCKVISNLGEKYKNLRISVKISRVTLIETGIISTFLEECRKYQVNPSRITIEITENNSKVKRKETVSILQDLKEAGFRVSLDDFGSHYSNMALLSQMKFDEVKIDQSLVDDISSNSISYLMIAHVAKLCHTIDETDIIVEGVENEEQRELLISCKCQYGQGFLFSEPLPLHEFEQLLN